MFNKLAIAKTTNYLILIQFIRIYNKKSIVKKFRINKLILFAIIEINKNANKKKIKISKVIKITIIIRMFTLIIKNLIKIIKNLKKKIKIIIAKIVIKTKIVTIIIVNNNNLRIQEYTKIANIIIKTQHTIIATK